jgi:sugar O-acyltransferase (sialic acid O-acetyltransferase NeuD family)
MRKPLYIYGAGGLGREVLALIRDLESWEPRGFIDDNAEKGKIIKNLPVLGGNSILRDLGNANVIIAVGSPLLKKNLGLLLPANINSPVLIHPRATLLHEDSILIGEGSIVCAGVVLTTDVKIGDHVLINLNSTIGHDSSIGSFSSVMPGVNIAGDVIIGEGVLLGSGCNIMNRVKIGENSRVGMGAVVLRDVVEGDTMAGVPAKSILRQSRGEAEKR